MARILVVDDDALVRETIALALQAAGHSVVEASDGRIALQILSREPIDLVISDILMPEIDGIGLILAIQKQHPTMRVICMSGGDRTGQIDYLELAAKLGAQMVLAKPFTPKQLLAAVATAISMPPTTATNSLFYE
jgi:DNA-binding NtrC family response regulator